MDQDWLDRIRLLSARFHELQGLRVALFGAALAIVLGSYLIAAEPTETGVLIALAVAALMTLPGERWLARYYATTFGRQVSTSRDHRRVFLVFFAFGLLGVWLEPLRTSVAIVGAYSLWIAVRDWPWRAHYLGAAAAVAVGFAVQVFGNTTIDPDVTLATTFFLIGLAFVPIGFLDHRLLVRLTEEAREPEVAAATGHHVDEG